MTVDDSRLRRRCLRAGFALLALSLLRTAWVSDDAYITFRSIDNLVHGYGLVWNVGERVQSFTHPLWLLLMTPLCAVTGEPYFTVLALCAVCSLAAVWVIVSRLAVNAWGVVPVFAALLSSKAFIDYSTSGLENPLTHLLLVIFLWCWWTEPAGARRVGRLSLIGALCLLNRLDLAVLIGPALAMEAWRAGPRVAFRPVIVGMLPLVAWALFAAGYFGSPFPNTAYAKLGAGLPADWVYVHGLAYIRRTLVADPVTLPVIALSIVALGRDRWRRDWPLVAGVVLSTIYVVRIGGDFMMGRFFAAPFVWSVAILARAPWSSTCRRAGVLAGPLIVMGLLAPWEPAVLSGYGYSRLTNLLHGDTSAEPRDRFALVKVDSITDERRFYEQSALLRQRPGHLRPDPRAAAEGIAWRAQVPPVVVFSYIGYRGFHAGPGVHIIDDMGLADPLLARLPARPDSFPGHFKRDLPEGYKETIVTGVNRIADPDLASYYERFRVVVSGPVLGVERLWTIAQLLSGRHDAELRRYAERHPTQ